MALVMLLGNNRRFGNIVLDGDANSDGKVNFLDFGILSASFGRRGVTPYSVGDINGDGVVNFLDFAILSANFGAYV